MSNYPDGAATDKRAPYNETEPKECPVCEGNGFIVDEPLVPKCTNCNGKGYLGAEEEE